MSDLFWISFGQSQGVPHLTSNGKQSLQQDDGDHSGKRGQLGVVSDGRPERHRQQGAGDHNGDQNQEPLEPLEGNDPQHLGRAGGGSPGCSRDQPQTFSNCGAHVTEATAVGGQPGLTEVGM